MRSNYQTKQKELLLNIIKNMNREFSIRELYKLSGVGLTTIYRFIEKLECDGVIKKIVINNNIYYQYLDKCLLDNHFYLKCSSCGKMIHVDCDCINKLVLHIFDIHGFKMNKNNIIIPGKCMDCEE